MYEAQLTEKSLLKPDNIKTRFSLIITKHVNVLTELSEATRALIAY